MNNNPNIDNNNQGILNNNMSANTVPNNIPLNPQQPTVNYQVSQQQITQQPVQPTYQQVQQQYQNVNQPTEVQQSTQQTRNQQEINYTPLSKFKTFILILFFIVLIGFVLFLPEISAIIKKYKSGTLVPDEKKIENGQLTCTVEKTTAKYDEKFQLVYQFFNNKLSSYKYTKTTVGDMTTDEEELVELENKCKILASSLTNVKGITVRCEYLAGTLTENQKYDLSNIENEKITSAFTEAGLNYTEYEYHEDMDKIEKNMNASGYTCKRSE